MTQLKKIIDDVFVTLQEKFPTATIQYQYIGDTHFVKVAPVEVYHSENFIDIGIELYHKFDELNLEELLCFVTEGSLIKLDKPSRIYTPIDIKAIQKGKLAVSQS
jgi:hypothetical protein